MIYKRPDFWSWFPLGIVSFVILVLSAFNPLKFERIGQVLSFGTGTLMGIGALMNFLHHAGVIAVDVIKEVRPDTYRLSQNYRAELLLKMNRDQLKAWRVMGESRIGILARGKDQLPVEMIYGRDVSMAFFRHFLNTSTERTPAAMSSFFKETHHWDWTRDNVISDWDQAHDALAYLCMNGWAEWNGNGTSAVWAMSPDGTRWTPEDIKHIHGMIDEEQDEEKLEGVGS